MREGSRRAFAFAFAFALVAGAIVPASVFAAELPPGVQTSATPALPPGCVAKLVDAHANGYASHYVIAGAYAYGEWRTSGYGGQSLWKRSGEPWCKVATGLTVLDRRALVGFGLPASTAKHLLALMHASGELAPPVLSTSRLAGHAGVRRAQR